MIILQVWVPIQGSPWHVRVVVDFKSRGCRKLTRGNTAVPILGVYVSVARFTGVCTAAAAAAAAAAVPLLYVLRGCFY